MDKKIIFDNRKSCLVKREIKFFKSQIYREPITPVSNSQTFDLAKIGQDEMSKDGVNLTQQALDI